MRLRGLKRILTEAGIGLAMVICMPSNLYAADVERPAQEARQKIKINLADKIIPNGHFTWAEATKNGERMPENEEVVEEIKKAAAYMEEIRAYFGNRPIKVNSWYRNPEVNKETGGKDKSEHIKGNAVDFVVSGVSPEEVHKKLDEYWGSKGGLGKYPSFTHIDSRRYKARWEEK